MEICLNPCAQLLDTTAQGGVILAGPKGLYQLKDGMIIAKRVLGDESCHHPDFIQLGDGDSQITVEEVEAVIEKLSLQTAKAKRHVVMVHSLDQMTLQAQNKLLKTLEEGDAFFILISYDMDVLPTIKSRLLLIPYYPLSMKQYMNQTGKGAAEYYLSGGCPQTEVVEEENKVFERVKEAVLHRKGKFLLEVLHLVKEKDKDSFYEKKRDKIPMLFAYIGRIIYEMEQADYEIIVRLAQMAENAKKNTYTGADFFADMFELCVWLERER